LGFDFTRGALERQRKYKQITNSAVIVRAEPFVAYTSMLAVELLMNETGWRAYHVHLL